ncbi:MAG: hypothetical protein AAF628_32555 [Planctomycetota bacterium]
MHRQLLTSILTAAATATGLCAAALSAQRSVPISGGQMVLQDDAVQTTTSNAWVDLPGMGTRVNLPSGGQCSVSLTMDAGITEELRSPTLFVRVLVDGQPMDGDVSFTRERTITTNTAHFGVNGLTPGQHQIRAQWRTDIIDPAFGGATSQARRMTARWSGDDTPHVRIASAHLTGSTILSGAYYPMPQLNAAIHGGLQFYRPRLLVMVSGEFRDTTPDHRVFVRLNVNGTRTKDVVVNIGDQFDLCSFAFTVEPNHAARYDVQAEWSADDTATCRNVSMSVVATSQATNEETAFLDQSPPSGPSVRHGSASWIPVPGAGGGTIHLATRADLEIRFSSEMQAATGAAAYLRCLFDGRAFTAPGTAQFSRPYRQVGLGRGPSRETVFVVPDVAPGAHTVQIEWSSSGSTWIGDRTLAVSAITGKQVSPGSLTLLSAATVHNVSNAPIDLSLPLASGVQSVSIAGRVIDQTTPQFPGIGWFEVRKGNLRLYPPQGIAPGPMMVRAHFPDSTTNAVSVQMTLTPTLELATPATQPAGSVQDFVISRGSASPGAAAWVVMSPLRTPSVLPGVLNLGIGGGFQQLYLLTRPLGFSTAGSAAHGRQSIIPGLVGATLHYQGLVLDGATFRTTNTRTTLYQ